LNKIISTITSGQKVLWKFNWFPKTLTKIMLH